MATHRERSDGTSDGEGKFSVLLIASLISSLIMLDSNIVAVSLPAIARSMHATFADIEWVVSAYVLAFAALLLAAGSFADRHGRKKATLIGLVVFTTASGMCALANTALLLNLARALQGIGSALLLTASIAVINQAFSGPRRAKAYAFWGACLGIAITIGPIAGGVITDIFGWRFAFLVNLPVGVAFFVAALLVLSESSDPDATQLDFAGIVTFSAGLFSLIWALVDGNVLGWTAAAIVERLSGAAVLLTAFVVVEWRQARPMVDLALFKRPTFLGAVFAMLGYSASAQVLIFFLPLFLQNVYKFSPTVAGLGMLPFAFPMFLTPRLGSVLSMRFSGRSILAIGLATTTVGNLLLFALATAAVPYATLAGGMLVAGAGAGLLNSETAKVLQSAVSVQRAGMASGVSATTRFVGLLLGVAAFGAVLSRGVVRPFLVACAALGLPSDVARTAVKRVASGDLAGVFPNVSSALQVPLHSAASAAFSSGFASASLVAAVVAATTGTLAFCLVRAADTAPDSVIGRHPASIME